MERTYSIIIVGAGAAGVGFGVALKKLGIDDFLILEKGEVGQTFKNWPRETKFITPSFTTNGFGMVDLNAIAPTTSPGYTMGKEHLTGTDYAEYLKLVSDVFELPIKTQVEVQTIEKQAERVIIKTAKAVYDCDYLIMAVGEFSNSQTKGIKGAGFGIHYKDIQLFERLTEKEQIIIGGNESSMDMACSLSEKGINVTVYTSSAALNSTNPDPSVSLSSYTRERLLTSVGNKGSIRLIEKMRLVEIKNEQSAYQLKFANGHQISSPSAPLLGTGFSTVTQQVGPNLFYYNQEGRAILNEHDESERSENVFLIGSTVKHGSVNLCYIYKFRQRFAYIVEEISTREGWIVDQEELRDYKNNGMYLDDYSCCDVECKC